MTFKQWSAVIELVVQTVIAGWLAFDLTRVDPWPGPVAAVAVKLVWALGASVLSNVVLTIVVTIVVSMARGEPLKDERADERDRAVGAKSMRNAYVVVSIGVGVTLLLLALGTDPALVAYAMFASALFGSMSDSISRLVYYHIG